MRLQFSLECRVEDVYEENLRYTQKKRKEKGRNTHTHIHPESEIQPIITGRFFFGEKSFLQLSILTIRVQ